jgi:pyruvate kinase
MIKKLLCTLGPASFHDGVIQRLEELGTNLFRINLSHTRPEDLAETIDFIRQRSNVPICLDSEGAQIRTGSFVNDGFDLREATTIRIPVRRVPGDASSFNLYPKNIIHSLQVGDFISIDFNAVLVQIIALDEDEAVMRVMSGGRVGRNKAVTVERDIPLPPLTEKDRVCIEIGIEKGISNFALSFANTGADVEVLRNLVGSDAYIISKIESLRGIRNLDEIAASSNALLIDRGDLSRQAPIESIPNLQKDIIRRGKACDREVFVATNLLESMITSIVPTRAEINDIYNTLNDGADGLVLAAETAIGEYPVRCANMVVRMIRAYEDHTTGASLLDQYEGVSLLTPPVGNKLVQRKARSSDIAQLGDLPLLKVAETDLMDAEQIAHGTYSPITGFMDNESLESVLTNHRLPDGTVWTMPIVLQAASEDLKGIGAGERLGLVDEKNLLRSVIDVSEVYSFDFETVARGWFGSVSDDHPGVRRLRKKGNLFVAGDVTLLDRLTSPHRHFELTPAQTRMIFAHKGWSKVVGFHTRNVAHRAHFHIQMEALRLTAADGLYISPVIGPKKPDDFLAEPIMQSYQLLMEFGEYPIGKAVLGSFATYPRYAGPREAVFTALCRKNMGCSHFIIGRDHTGVGDFYALDANRRLFEDLGDIGIEPVFFPEIGYDSTEEAYRAARDGEQLESISGTRVRELLGQGERLPSWFMHDIVQDYLLEERAQGRALFYT